MGRGGAHRDGVLGGRGVAAARVPRGRGRGAARAELAEAVGVPAEHAAFAARELLDAMAGIRGLDSALGLWTKRTLELREAIF